MDEQNTNQDPVSETQPDQEVNKETTVATEPVATTPVVSEQVTPSTSANPVKAKKARSKWFLPAVFGGLLVLGGGAAAYVTVFQKTPESVWKSALSNTADGLDQYLKNSYDANQKGFKLDGNFKISSPLAVDGSMSGQWYESDGELKFDVGAAGSRVNAELRTIKPEGGSTPDIYMKVDGLDGIDSLVSSLGMPAEAGGLAGSFSALNDQWFFIDHTLIDQATASSQSSTLDISEAEAKAIADKVSAVLRDRMFTTASDKAIFTISEKLGKEDFEGTSSQKVKVSVDKDKFKDFVTALKDSIKDTKAEELIKASQKDKSLEEILDFDNLIKELDKADFSKASADVWIEANGAYIRNVRLYPVDGKKDTNYLDFGMNYKGGDLFPFQIKATMDDNGSKGTLTLGVEVNQKNGDASVSFNVDLTNDGSPVKAEGKITVNGSNEDTKVEKPADAKNVFELIGGFQQSLTEQYYQSLDDSTYQGLDNYDDLQLQ